MPPITYEIDSTHSSVHFSVRHLMVSNVRGEFTKVSGTVKFDPENPATSSVEATIDANSISTRDPQRDGHLKSADFLDTEKFPTITFRSKKVDVRAGRRKSHWRLNDSRSHSRDHSRRRRSVAGNEGSLGQAAYRRLRNHQAQPQGIRPDMECSPGNRWRDGRRRSEDQHRCRICPRLTRAARLMRFCVGTQRVRRQDVSWCLLSCD